MNIVITCKNVDLSTFLFFYRSPSLVKNIQSSLSQGPALSALQVSQLLQLFLIAVF